MLKNKILVLGASGMLGNAVLKFFHGSEGCSVVGSARSGGGLRYLPKELQDCVVCGVDVENLDSLMRLFTLTRPEVVINCIGLVKQLSEADDPLAAIPINALLPHRLARLCAVAGARFIHMSTDCVFAGTKGMYREVESTDARDLYGLSKYLGEVDYPHAITLRTSIIGHELNSAHGLIGWFLAQNGAVNGFTRAIFSGLPTVELARVIRDFVIPNPELRGVYHVSAEPIAKYDLLQLVAHVYEKNILINPDDSLVIDRSLNSERFRKITGYQTPAWPELIRRMREFA
ncbi:MULTISPECIES: SDR family oxidoreductase [unclassified Polaromonas]|uniref:dTDP-4-dehydrorhamnose reductase family protein n=1 Tax=unclassified Polaromonas TaxID=2638319 RepID=UPI0018C8F397|nr:MULTISPECIES: SDR family oxidoreductase [unclassified Polaromonas]MBG6073085.1 dTDP-4-dehydrorhamnose reductase [Polaromonas sp. CG_9.7]MBG6115090.1 dTDP-4-dehydrorhamnose reductase [Polaromonas sp. CG_9.2]